jgi:hypothetical protein
MYSMIRIILLTCCTAFIFFACKKDDKTKTKAELLANGSWHVTAYTVDPPIDWDGDGTDESDVYPVIEPCIKDDHTTFFADGTGELNEGATKCNQNDPQTVPLTWDLDQTETHLTVQGVLYLIDVLTETQMVLKDVEVISTVSFTHTVTFSH